MRKNSLRALAAVCLLFLLESLLFNRLRIFGARPELLLIATIFFGFQFGPVRGLEMGLLAGALKDVFSITPFGVNTFSFLAIGCLSGFFREKIFREGLITQFLFSSACVYIISGVYFFCINWILKCEAPGDFWRISLLKGLYTGCLGPVLFFILRKIIKPEEAQNAY